MDEEEKSAPTAVEPATTDGAASSPPSPPAAPVAPPSATEEPARRGPGRPKGSSSKKKKKGKPSKPSKPAKVVRPSVDDDDEGDDDEGDEPPRAELARVEPSQPPSERDPSLHETPEERAQRYDEMRQRIVRHAPTWERRADSLALPAAIDLMLVVASGIKEVSEPDAFEVSLPTSGGARRIKTSGGGAVVRALAQIVAAYSPEHASDVVAHPLADAAAALGQVAAAVAMARLAPLLRELMKGSSEDEQQRATDAAIAPRAAA